MVLTRSQARTFYDRFGIRQDSQAFYEDAALDDLVSHAAFEQAESVFEFGCGTGRFASQLLTRHLPGTARYLGVDISQTMIDIARPRVATYGERARVKRSDGAIAFPLPAASVDRVVSTYVLDLLSDADILEALSEARRVLAPGGTLCLVGLTRGTGLVSKIVSGLWSLIFRLHAPTVGGCRPIRLVTRLDTAAWRVDYHHVVTRFGVPSEVLIATPVRHPGTGTASG